MQQPLDSSSSGSLQDRDLLHRLSMYFDAVDTRLQLGEGWVIFNASGRRSRRITRFVLSRARDIQPIWTYVFLPWRDVALTSYLTQIEFKGVESPERELTGAARREYDIATRVSRQTMTKSITADLLIVSDLRPKHEHEILYLEQTIESRYRNRLSTIILTPEQPHELANDISSNAPFGEESWHRISARFYELNLIAL